MKNKYLKYIGILSITAVIFSLTGCLKDHTSPGSENYGNSPALVSFQYTGFAFAPSIASILGTSQDTFSIEVTLSVNSQTLGKDVTATIAADQTTLSTYNADTTRSDTPTNYVLLPSSDFTLPNNGTITIPAGKNMVNFTIHLAGDKIDFSKDYALALKITAASGATIASNLNTYIALIKLKSIYAGNYKGSGARIRYNGATEASGVLDSYTVSGIIPFGTVSKKEIDGQAGDSQSGYNMALLIHDDQPAPYPVDVLKDPLNPAITPTAGFIQGTNLGQSTYNPTTKTFDLHFGYLNGSGNLREVNEQLVLQ